MVSSIQLVKREKTTVCFLCFDTFFSILACYYNMPCYFAMWVNKKQATGMKARFDKRIFIVTVKH